MKREIIKKVLATLGLLIQILAEFVQGVKKDFKSYDLLRSFPYIYINIFIKKFNTRTLKYNKRESSKTLS